MLYFRKFFWHLRNARNLREYLQVLLMVKRFVFFSTKKFAIRVRYRNAVQSGVSHQLFSKRDYRPLISIVVTNYNHGKYLKDRLDTIYAQDYENFEVLLLDDKSNDNSLEILKDYQSRYSTKTRLFINQENSGNGYQQWKKGISNAKGDLIWIAESDDLSESTFLSTLVLNFRNNAVRIAFSNTIFFEIDPSNEIWNLASYWYGHSLLSSSEDWTMFDTDFMSAGMAKCNLIPNVSSVVFRKPSKYQLQASWSEYSFCGDWLFYSHQMSGGLVSYNSKVRNFYRVHPESTIKMNMHTEIFSKEVERAQKEIHELILRPRVLFVLPGLVLGGGEIFPFRFAQICEKYGVVAAVLDLGILQPNDEDLFLNNNSVPLFQPIINYDFVTKWVNKWDLVYSHHASADEICARFKPKNFPHLVSTHGMYEEMEKRDVARLEDLFSKNMPVFTYTLEKNMSGFSKSFLASSRFIKVSNFIPDLTVPHKNQLRLSIGDEIKVCLFSRAIPGKGWSEAVQAVNLARELSGLNIHLYLFGSGPVNEEISRVYSFDWLHQGLSRDPLLTATEMHIGLFLSSYKGESMPFILIEFLAVGLPTVFTSNGLSREMMSDSHGNLGVCLGEVSHGLNIQQAASAILEIIRLDEFARQELKDRMHRKFEYYSEGKNMQSYLAIFQGLIKVGKGQS